MVAHSVYTMERGKPEKEKLDAIPSFITEFRQEHQIQTNSLVIGLSHKKIMLREIEYPLSVKDSLRSTLEYDVDKYIPLSADDIYFDYQIIEEDRGNNRLKILLAMIKKTDCEPYLSFCRKWPGGVYGLSLSTAATANGYAFLSGDKKRSLNGHVREILAKGEAGLPDGDSIPSSVLEGMGIPSIGLIPAFGLGIEILWDVPVRLNLLPLEIRKRPSRVGQYVLMGLIALLILSGVAWGGGHLFRQQMRFRAVAEEAKRLSSEVAAVTEIEERIKEVEKNISTLKGIKGNDQLILEILKELTQTIPETAYLTEFRLTDKGIQLIGYAESASDLIPLLELSPLFEDVEVLSGYTRDPRKRKERFHFGLKPVSLKDSEE
jgi:Tfp pilus assembly protein PilN